MTQALTQKHTFQGQSHWTILFSEHFISWRKWIHTCSIVNHHSSWNMISLKLVQSYSSFLLDHFKCFLLCEMLQIFPCGVNRKKIIIFVNNSNLWIGLFLVRKEYGEVKTKPWVCASEAWDVNQRAWWSLDEGRAWCLERFSSTDFVSQQCWGPHRLPSTMQ